MQRHYTHCMHKVHRSYKYMVQRRDVVIVATVSDGGVKKEVECSS